ncbi:MAG: AAA family ATPase, partial [Burkholderiaceae bacterium]
MSDLPSPQQPLPAFALAKIQPPRLRAGLIARPVLEQALGEALRHSRLTLLLAPAGYGKTAALTRQIRQLPEGCALAWVSVDEDDQLQRFLACLAAALEPYDLPWRVAPEALVILAEGGLRGVAGEIVNALAAAEVARGLIVIDDAHRLVDPKVFELLQLVIELLPAHWSLALASRVEPPLALARLRGLGELTEFRQYDLRFDESEVAALLASSAGPGPAMSSARALVERTGGWAAGLRLSLNARVGASPQGGARLTQRHLFDYLAAEVLADMPEDLREFLLRCSVLPELTAARCARVSGVADAQCLLEQVERRGLFVSMLDADEPTLRLHDLFRDFLEDRLQRDRPDELPALLVRAASAEPDVTRAVGYLMRAGAWPDAAQRLVHQGPQLLALGGGSLEQLLALLFAEAFERWPDMYLLRGIAAFIQFEFDTAVVAIERASAGFLRDARPLEASSAQAYACLAMQSTGRLHDAERELARLRELPLTDPARAFVGFGAAWAEYAHTRTENVAGAFASMLDALERAPVLQVWNLCFFQSFFTGLPGMAPLQQRFARGALSLAGDMPSHMRAGVRYTQAWSALDAGHLDQAVALTASGDDDCHWLGLPRSVVTESRMTHVLLDALRGDRAASRAAADACEADLRQGAMLSNRMTHEYEVLSTHARASWILQDDAVLRGLAEAMMGCANPHEWPAAALHRR